MINLLWHKIPQCFLLSFLISASVNVFLPHSIISFLSSTPNNATLK